MVLAAVQAATVVEAAVHEEMTGTEALLAQLAFFDERPASLKVVGGAVGRPVAVVVAEEAEGPSHPCRMLDGSARRALTPSGIGHCRRPERRFGGALTGAVSAI